LSGTDLQSGILVTPPAGFEVSTDGNTFSGTVTVGAAGTASTTTVYVRLAATTHVGSYSGKITLTSTGATAATEQMPISTVNPAPLTVIADDKSRAYGAANPVLTASYEGFVNGDGPAQLTTLPTIATTATIASPIGQYPITASGAAAHDYDINTYIPGILTIIEPPTAIVIPNTFTPNGDGINDTWNIKYLNSYMNCLVNIFDRYGQNVFTSIGYGIPWDGTYRGSKLPVGTYYYLIDLKTGYKLLSGFVAIIR
jgi:gliding motility-associated-like protein